MYCPQCRSEYQDHVQTCANCEVALVRELPAEDGFASAEAMARSLKDRELEALVVGNHVELGKTQQDLATQRIASVIVGDDEQQMAAGAHQRFFLMIAKDDFERARAFFAERWKGGLNTEGLMIHDQVEAVQVDVCPACATKVGAGQSECPECGLFLGDPENVG